MAGVKKGYKQADTHRLRINRSLRLKSIERLDAQYVARRKALTMGLEQIEADLTRAEAIEKAAKAAPKGVGA